MRSREVQQFLASITGRPIGEIDQRNRRAREAFKIPSGPRGLNAPHMSVEDGLIHILTLPSRRVVDAWDVAMRLWDVKLVPHPEHPGLSEAFKGESRLFPMFLLLAMRNGLRSIDFKMKSFEMSETGDFAVMNFDRRSLLNVRFVFSGNKAHWTAAGERRNEIYSSVEQLSAGNRFVLGASHLKSLGDRMIADCPLDEPEESHLLEVESIASGDAVDGSGQG